MVIKGEKIKRLIDIVLLAKAMFKYSKNGQNLFRFVVSSCIHILCITYRQVKYIIDIFIFFFPFNIVVVLFA